MLKLLKMLFFYTKLHREYTEAHGEKLCETLCILGGSLCNYYKNLENIAV